MKTIVTLVLVLATTVAGAVERPKLDVFPLTASRAVVTLSDEYASQIEIAMRSADGSLLYHNQITQSTSGYRKIFNFSFLEDGMYELSFKVDGTLVKRSVETKNGTLKIGVSELRFDPYFSFENNVLKLTYLNFDEKRISLTIMNNNELVWESDLGDSFNTTRGFDLSKLESGWYKVILASGNQDYAFHFEK